MPKPREGQGPSLEQETAKSPRETTLAKRVARFPSRPPSPGALRPGAGPWQQQQQMPSEADEVAELKSMFGSPARGRTIPINKRPAWDSTPLRGRPPQLIGLKPVTREPWAVDEDVYNRRFETRDVGIRA